MDNDSFEPWGKAWLPNGCEEVGPPLHYYDGPLIGIFKFKDQHWLYQCILGHASRQAQTWLYSQLAEDHARLLSNEADISGKDLDALFDFYAARAKWAALSIDTPTESGKIIDVAPTDWMTNND